LFLAGFTVASFITLFLSASQDQAVVAKQEAQLVISPYRKEAAKMPLALQEGQSQTRN